MVSQNAVLQLCGQLFRKSRNLPDPLRYHLCADDNVAQKLSVVGVVVFWESGKLSRLADIVEQRPGEKADPGSRRGYTAAK